MGCGYRVPAAGMDSGNPERELARRFRRRALLAFAGFGVATYALGWLLQGVFG